MSTVKPTVHVDRPASYHISCQLNSFYYMAFHRHLTYCTTRTGGLGLLCLPATQHVSLHYVHIVSLFVLLRVISLSGGSCTIVATGRTASTLARHSDTVAMWEPTKGDYFCEFMHNYPLTCNAILPLKCLNHKFFASSDHVYGRRSPEIVLVLGICK